MTTRARWLRTLRGQAILGLSLLLAIAAGVSVLIDLRITGDQLRDQAEQIVGDNLEVAMALVADDRAALRTALRNSAQSLQVAGLDLVTQGVEARRQANLIQLVLDTDGIGLIDQDGQVIVSSGVTPVNGTFQPQLSTTSALQLVGALDGQRLEAIGVPVSESVWLVGVQVLDSARAFEIRRLLIGSEVVLVDDGVLVGSTSADIVQQTLAALDLEQTSEVAIGSSTALIGFTQLGPRAYVGVATPELLEGLAAELVAGRLLVLFLTMLVGLGIGNVLIRSRVRPLSELARTAEAVRAGDLSQPFHARSDNEIGRLADTLESMRAGLREQLAIIMVQADTINRATQRIVTARDVERRRMAQDLHDGVQQQLVMLRLRIGLLDDRTGPAEREAVGQDVEAVITQVRETSQAIFPSILADRGLSGALYSLAAGSLVSVELDLDPEPLPRMQEAVEAGLYFIVSEALSNVVKHARAERIRIRARVGQDSVLIMVSDYGDGFDPMSVTEGSGLQNLRDRAVALGGVAHIRSEPGIGTVVAVRLPLQRSGAPVTPSVRTTLQEEQDRGDAAVQIIGVAKAELSEDGARVLLDRPLADDQLLGDA